MATLMLGDLAMDLSPDSVFRFDELGCSYSDFLIPSGSLVADAQVRCQPLDAAAPFPIQEGYQKVNCGSLGLYQTDANYLAVRKLDGTSRALWVAESDCRFRDVLLWLDSVVFEQHDARESFLTSTASYLPYLFLTHLADEQSGLLLHTAAVEIDGRMWLFAGRSKAGKSTLARLFLGQDQYLVVNNDRALVRPSSEGVGFTAYSIPWPGEDRIARNQSAALAGICFLHQSERSVLRSLSALQALPQLLSVAAIPWYDQELLGSALDICDRLLSSVPAYELHFRPDQSAVEAVLAFAA